MYMFCSKVTFPARPFLDTLFEVVAPPQPRVCLIFLRSRYHHPFSLPSPFPPFFNFSITIGIQFFFLVSGVQDTA